MVRIVVCLALIIGLLTRVICTLTRVRIRTVEGEIWIRQLRIGDLDYRVELKSRDEITKALHASPAHVKPGKPGRRAR